MGVTYEESGLNHKIEREREREREGGREGERERETKKARRKSRIVTAGTCEQKHPNYECPP